MHHFSYRDGRMWAEEVPLAEIADQVGTPTYVYSSATLTRHFNAFKDALGDREHLICYSVKANGSLAILNLFGKLGGGADVVSWGEAEYALAAGIPAERIVFSGVGKQVWEMEAGLKAGILMFNVESLPELETLAKVAERLGKKVGISIRVNPDVDPKTHPYISTGLKQNKFGLDLKTALTAFIRAKELNSVEVLGIDFHIGSQLTELSPFVETLNRLSSLIDSLREQGIEPRYLDLGGGLGIPYSDEKVPLPSDYVAALSEKLEKFGLIPIFEPGRSLVGNAGILLTRAIYTKQTEDKRFLIVDAAMNDLLRPGLYGSYHEILPVGEGREIDGLADVVGPICESTDWLAKDRAMPRVEAGELLAIMSAGAYGFAMASNFNARGRAAEVLVKGDRFAQIRERETIRDLLRGQTVPELD